MVDNNLKIVMVAIGLLKPAEYNPRKWDEAAISGLKESISRFGMIDPIIVNNAPERLNIVIGGHFRLHVAKQLGFTAVPVVYISIPEEARERELNLRLNRNLGEFDLKALADFGEELLTSVGWTTDELDKIFELKQRPDDDEVPEVKTTDIKLGDMFKLGEHRLLCGDATKKEDIDKLMAGGGASINGLYGSAIQCRLYRWDGRRWRKA